MNRKCNKCHEIKPLTEFYKTGRKSDKDPNARHHECKKCAKTRVKATRDPERSRDLHLQRRYGITLATFNRMVLSQGSKCACCGTSRPGGKHNQWCVDHNHVTGDVRQLLCKDCNIVLGLVEDSPEHLQRLIDYILRNSDGRTNSRTVE